MISLIKSIKVFEGDLNYYQHVSEETQTPMKFTAFVPKGRIRGALLWLSGLECNEETFQIKAGAQKYLAEAGLIAICPDTSPRGLHLPGEHESWDFGSAASFYVDATTEGYKDHYRMYSYLTKELYALIETEFGVAGHISVCGHSMGGHGALVMGLRAPAKFKSVSAFAPIVNPINSPWGKKAFAGYLGEEQKGWSPYDACELIKNGAVSSSELLIDQGTTDRFLKEQLLTENILRRRRTRSRRSRSVFPKITTTVIILSRRSSANTSASTGKEFKRMQVTYRDTFRRLNRKSAISKIAGSRSRI